MRFVLAVSTRCAAINTEVGRQSKGWKRLGKVCGWTGVKVWLLQKIHVEGARANWGSEESDLLPLLLRPETSPLQLHAFSGVHVTLSHSPGPNFLFHSHIAPITLYTVHWSCSCPPFFPLLYFSPQKDTHVQEHLSSAWTLTWCLHRMGLLFC